MRNFLLTGKINSGKSTLVYEMAKRATFSCGGIVSLPVFDNGTKTGMDAVDIMNGKTKILARLKGRIDGIDVGRYTISQDGLKHGENAIRKAIRNCDIVVIDEFGPLEMEGRGMAKVAEDAFRRGNALVVLRKGLKERFMEKYGQYNFKVIDFDSISADELAKILERKL